jgi:hypothetical protein
VWRQGARGMSAEEREAQGGRAAALGFYFNADDTWRAGPATPEPWDVTWVAAEPELPPQAEPARRGGARWLIALALALAAGAAMALTWSLTPERRPAPEAAAPVEPTAPPPETSAPAPAQVAATPAAPHRRQHVRPAHRRHAAATHARAGPAAKASKARRSRPAPYHQSVTQRP